VPQILFVAIAALGMQSPLSYNQRLSVLDSLDRWGIDPSVAANAREFKLSVAAHPE
jgi:hypothetical protein